MGVIKTFLGKFAIKFRWSYLPPLMIYFAAGVSGFTGIIESFFVKEQLGLTAEFLAGLAFWAGIPWALKMPMGHLVDLFWRWKSSFVFIGAGLMGASLLIMVGLTGYTDWMAAIMGVDIWYIIAVLLAPVGYMMQDVVADAMTVEAVPHVKEDGSSFTEDELRGMHVTMQTLGRIAIVTGGMIVAGAGGWLAKVFSYETMYTIALVIPFISIAGVFAGFIVQYRREKNLLNQGFSKDKVREMLDNIPEKISPNWLILGGSLVFVAFTLFMGSSGLPLSQEIIFGGSMAIFAVLIYQLVRELAPEKRRELIGIALIIFAFRATPSYGAGAGWWQIDVLEFDEAFFGTLRQIASILALIGMFALRSWMASRPVHYFVVFLTVLGSVLALPYIGMFYGLHEWTEATFGFGAHTIAIVDTMADAPFGQVAMIPMLAWIAIEAPKNMKATYFAVMAAFVNLALSASHLGTKYLNQIFTVTREVTDRETGAVTPADYSELGMLMMTGTAITFALPILAVLIFTLYRKKHI